MLQCRVDASYGDIDKLEQEMTRVASELVMLRPSTNPPPQSTEPKIGQAKKLSRNLALDAASDLHYSRFRNDPDIPQANAIGWQAQMILDSWERGVTLVASKSNPTSFVTLTQSEDALQIAFLRVAQEERGQGVGQSLLIGALDYAREQGKDLFARTHEGNHAAIALYVKCGFVRHARQVAFHRHVG